MGIHSFIQNIQQTCSTQSYLNPPNHQTPTKPLKLQEIKQKPSNEKMGLIQTYDLSSRITSSDPGISSARTVSEEMGPCFWAFMTLSMSFSLVRTTLVTSTARENAHLYLHINI